MIQPHFDMPCVILCGGKSSRMGEDKALLPFADSNSLVQYQYERLKPYFKEIYLSSKTDKFDFDANIIYDNEEISSPLIALKKILESINFEKAFILTVDTPFVKTDTINKLITDSSDFEITVAQTIKLHSLCGVFDKSCLSTINIMLDENNHKIGNLLMKSNTNIIDFADDMEFLNLNKKEDYLKAISIIS